MGRKKVIRESMTDNEKFNLCLKEGWELEKDEFSPELDNLNRDTIADVLFKVLTEWDLAMEGMTDVPEIHLKRVERYFVRWREYIEDEPEKYKYQRF